MKEKKIKKIFKIIIISVIAVFSIALISYKILLLPVSKENENVEFVVEAKTSKFDIIKNLKNAGLIKNEIAAIIYTGFHKLNFQAGTYSLNRSDGTPRILRNIDEGLVIGPEVVNVTFIEGKRVVDYAKLISESFGYKYNDVLAIFKDKDFAQELIKKYSFLDQSILNNDIYYPLEGYLFPNTYSFYENAKVEEIIEKMVKEMGNKLNDLKQNIDDSNLTIHDLLSMASIIEMEGTDATNRAKIAQVINKRISLNMNLGMDVTTYYAVQKDITEPLTKDDLASTSKYNTRLSTNLGLPIGPICNPSLESITAALNPSATGYIYFYASKDGEIKFTDNYDEFQVFKRNG